MISEGKSVTTETNGKNDGEAKTTPGYLLPELVIKAELAKIFEAKSLEKDNENCLRFYKSNPDGWTLQIRTNGGINDPYGRNGPGKARNMIATIGLSREQVKQIYEYMEATK